MPADARLIDALAEIVASPEPALSVIAAWALGRLGDARALPAVRAGLSAPYRSVQAHSARALGTLGDADSRPLLLERFLAETEHGLAMAYASALGKLGAAEAVPALLAFLQSRRDPSARLELALDLARLAGDEHPFIRLWRSTRTEAGTGYAQALSAARRRLERAHVLSAVQGREWEACAELFARQNLVSGAECLAALLPQVPAGALSGPAAAIVAECAARLAEAGPARPEYLLLALHALTAAEKGEGG
jgi:HEAT repeat protein